MAEEAQAITVENDGQPPTPPPFGDLLDMEARPAYDVEGAQAITSTKFDPTATREIYLGPSFSG